MLEIPNVRSIYEIKTIEDPPSACPDVSVKEINSYH